MSKIYLTTLLLIVCACTSYAQTTYKGVTLDRGKDSETNCIYVFNDNADSVRVFIQYKIGNRYTEWIDYPVPELVPPSILDPYKIGCIDSAIIGLKLLDVKIVSNSYIIVDDKSDDNSAPNQKSLFQKIKSLFSNN